MPTTARSSALLAAAALAAGLLAGCGSGAAPAAAPSAAPAFPMTMDNCGAQLTIDQPPRRVMLIGAEAVPLLVAAGALDRVAVKAGEFPLAIYPDSYRGAVEAIPAVGGGANALGTAQITLESVIAERPDLVIGYEPRGSSVTRAGLAAAGIPLLTLPSYCRNEFALADPTFDDVYGQIEQFGKIFDTAATAHASATAQRQAVAAIRADGGGRSAAALFMPLGGAGLSAYGDGSMADAQFEALGLRNAFHDVRDRVFDVGFEQVLARDPEVLVLVHVEGTPEQITQALHGYPGADTLRAVRENRVLVLPFELTDPPTPLSVDGLRRLAEFLGSAP